MHTLPIFLLLIYAFWMGPSHAQQDPNLSAPQAAAAPVSGGNAFTQGLESFKNGDFTQSREYFTQLLSENPQDPVLLYNLGLVEFTDKHPGRALAYWRKALFLKPGYTPVLSGMAQLEKSQLLPQDTSVSPLVWLYWRVPLAGILTLALLLFCTAGFFGVRFAAQKKQSKPAPFGAFASFTFLFFVASGFAMHDYRLFHYETKATVMVASAPAHSSPNIDAPSLFEFREGDEVTIRRTQDDWLQVQKSATAVGWVKKNQILIHSGT